MSSFSVNHLNLHQLTGLLPAGLGHAGGSLMDQLWLLESSSSSILVLFDPLWFRLTLSPSLQWTHWWLLPAAPPGGGASHWCGNTSEVNLTLFISVLPVDPKATNQYRMCLLIVVPVMDECVSRVTALSSSSWNNVRSRSHLLQQKSSETRQPPRSSCWMDAAAFACFKLITKSLRRDDRRRNYTINQM